MLKTTTGRESIDQYVEAYGFCNWQAQEVIRERDRLYGLLKRAHGYVQTVADSFDHLDYDDAKALLADMNALMSATRPTGDAIPSASA